MCVNFGLLQKNLFPALSRDIDLRHCPIPYAQNSAKLRIIKHSIKHYTLYFNRKIAAFGTFPAYFDNTFRNSCFFTLKLLI